MTENLKASEKNNEIININHKFEFTIYNNLCTIIICSAFIIILLMMMCIFYLYQKKLLKSFVKIMKKKQKDSESDCIKSFDTDASFEYATDLSNNHLYDEIGNKNQKQVPNTKINNSDPSTSSIASNQSVDNYEVPIAYYNKQYEIQNRDTNIPIKNIKNNYKSYKMKEIEKSADYIEPLYFYDNIKYDSESNRKISPVETKCKNRGIYALPRVKPNSTRHKNVYCSKDLSNIASGSKDTPIVTYIDSKRFSLSTSSEAYSNICYSPEEIHLEYSEDKKNENCKISYV